MGRALRTRPIPPRIGMLLDMLTVLVGGKSLQAAFRFAARVHLDRQCFANFDG